MIRRRGRGNTNGAVEYTPEIKQRDKEEEEEKNMPPAEEWETKTVRLHEQARREMGKKLIRIGLGLLVCLNCLPALFSQVNLQFGAVTSIRDVASQTATDSWDPATSPKVETFHPTLSRALAWLNREFRQISISMVKDMGLVYFPFLFPKPLFSSDIYI